MLPQMIAFRAAMTRTGELAKPHRANEAKAAKAESEKSKADR